MSQPNLGPFQVFHVFEIWEWDLVTIRLRYCYIQVCAFAHEADPDMKGKILIRLANITEMQNQFEICMNGNNDY